MTDTNTETNTTPEQEDKDVVITQELLDQYSYLEGKVVLGETVKESDLNKLAQEYADGGPKDEDEENEGKTE